MCSVCFEYRLRGDGLLQRRQLGRPAAIGRPGRAPTSPGLVALGDQQNARLRAREQRAGSYRRSCRTPARCRSATADHLQHFGGRGLPLERLLGLVEQPRVLDRDHRLVGEGLQQRDLLVGERLRRLPQDRRCSRCRGPPTASAQEAESCRCSTHVAHRAVLRHRSQCRGTLITAPVAQAPAPVTVGSTVSESPRVALDRRRRARPPTATVRRRRRGTCPAARSRTGAGNFRGSCRTPAAVSVTEPLMTSQHLGRRRLPLQRLLGLVEQPRVLDRDHRLVGEGLQQRDFRRLNGRRRLRRQRDRADRLAFPQHRHGQHRAEAVALLHLARRRDTRVRSAAHVLDVHGAALAERRRPPIERSAQRQRPRVPPSPRHAARSSSCAQSPSATSQTLLPSARHRCLRARRSLRTPAARRSAIR